MHLSLNCQEVSAEVAGVIVSPSICGILTLKIFDFALATCFCSSLLDISPARVLLVVVLVARSLAVVAAVCRLGAGWLRICVHSFS